MSAELRALCTTLGLGAGLSTGLLSAGLRALCTTLGLSTGLSTGLLSAGLRALCTLGLSTGAEGKKVYLR